MANVLITGMTAAQTSEETNERALAFPGVLARVLKLHGHEVTLSAPDMDWTLEDLERYDTVVAGISPVTSITASNAYGGLHVIDALWDTGKLVLMADSPRPAQIAVSLRSIVSYPDNLTKPFYAKRRGFVAASNPETRSRLVGVIERLLIEDWPTTIYPSLPWQDSSTIVSQFPANAAGSLVGLNLDAFLVSETPPRITERQQRWLVDNDKSSWIEKLLPTISSPVEPMKHRWRDSDQDVALKISESTGTLISSHRESTWWTYRIIQSLNCGTPVATEWRESMMIGESWNVIPSTVESLQQDDLSSLAWNQLDEYINSIPTREQIGTSIAKIFNGTQTKRKVKK